LSWDSLSDESPTDVYYTAGVSDGSPTDVSDVSGVSDGSPTDVSDVSDRSSTDVQVNQSFR